MGCGASASHKPPAGSPVILASPQAEVQALQEFIEAHTIPPAPALTPPQAEVQAADEVYDDDFEAEDDTVESTAQMRSSSAAPSTADPSRPAPSAPRPGTPEPKAPDYIRAPNLVAHAHAAYHDTVDSSSYAPAEVSIGAEVTASGAIITPDRADGAEALHAARETQAPWEVVRLDELQMGDVLGTGGMGTVQAAHWRGELVAVKTLHGASAAQLAELEAELFVHATLRHVGIVRLLGASLVPPACCIVLEHCLGSVFHRLHRSAEDVARRWLLTVALEVAEAMEYLHSRSPPIVHRDLKSQNVLLHSSGAAKLCDFGLVQVREATAGTPNYMAPELLMAKPYGRPVDVYAFAVLLNELHCREVPWDGYSPADIKALVASGKRPRTEMTMALDAERLLHRAWHQEAAVRPTFPEIVADIRRVIEALPLGVAALGLGEMPPDALDSLL